MAGAVAVAVTGAHAVGILAPVGRVGVVPGRRKSSKSMNVDGTGRPFIPLHLHFSVVLIQISFKLCKSINAMVLL